MKEPVVVATAVSKKYSRELRRSQRYGLGAIFDEFRPRTSRELVLRSSEFLAVDDVSFTLDRGQALGIVGRNGAGKSTLLRLIAGVSKPDLGSITVDGTMCALLDPSAGFNPILTGRENAEVGFTLVTGQRPGDRVLAEIAGYARLGHVFDDPLRTYSTGMRMRLGFSVMVHVEADLLLIDEALAVGDTAFQLGCVEFLNEYRRSGGSVIFVSHSLWLFQHLATTGLHLSGGRVALNGSPAEVTEGYLEDIRSDSLADTGAPDPIERESSLFWVPPVDPAEVPVDAPEVPAEADDMRIEQAATEVYPALDLPQRPVAIPAVLVTGPEGRQPRQGDPLICEMTIESRERFAGARVGFNIWSSDLAICIVGDLSHDVHGGRADGLFPIPIGRSIVRYTADAMPLAPGRYAFRAAVFEEVTGDVLGLHGFEDAPTWVQVEGSGDLGENPPSFSSLRLSPLRTMAGDWSNHLPVSDSTSS